MVVTWGDWPACFCISKLNLLADDLTCRRNKGDDKLFPFLGQKSHFQDPSLLRRGHEVAGATAAVVSDTAFIVAAAALVVVSCCVEAAAVLSFAAAGLGGRNLEGAAQLPRESPRASEEPRK